MLNQPFHYFSGLGLLIGLLYSFSGFAQAPREETDATFYLNLNQGVVTTIHEIAEAALNLQYEDRQGSQPALPLTVYNWKREAVAIYSLSKTYGSNYFRIQLGEVFTSWKTGEIYTVEARDEAGVAYELSLRKIEPVRKEKPTLRIMVNPRRFSCRQPAGNLVDFNAQISGGKAPYVVNWYVLNEERTQLLYQPREQKIEQAGRSMVVSIDKNPNYYILMQVQDACGNQQNQMVYLTCHEKKKKINTLFVEPIQKNDLPAFNPFK